MHVVLVTLFVIEYDDVGLVFQWLWGMIMAIEYGGVGLVTLLVIEYDDVGLWPYWLLSNIMIVWSLY